MNPSKLHILWYFMVHRWNRTFRSNRISQLRKKKWLNNLKRSEFYDAIVKKKSDFPIMNKASFMHHFDQINTAGITKKEAFDVALKSEKSRDFSSELKGYSIGLSSGTSGNRGIFLTSRREKAIWVGAILDRVIGFSLKKREVAFFLRANNNLYESVSSNLIRFHFFDLILPVADQMARLTSISPEILVAQPSVLCEIADHYASENIQPSFKQVISVAEVLEDDMKHRLRSVFQCRIDQVYQCTEGFLAYTCKNGSLHFNEDWLSIEKKYLDDKRFHPIITDYLRYTQPAVRYELNDIIHEGAPCACGSRATTIKKIEGRSDDVFRFKAGDREVILYPDFIRRAVITASDKISNYQVIKTGENRIEVSLKVNSNSEYNQVTQLVEEHLQELFKRFNLPRIELVQRPFSHSGMEKLRRIRNEYHKAI